jgi:hypothetical protein
MAIEGRCTLALESKLEPIRDGSGVTSKGKGVVLGGLALTAIGKGHDDVGSELALAITFYLSDREADRPGWTYPSFLPAASADSEPTVTVELETQTWDELAAEAERQGVAVDRLAAHAAIYFAAELDAGRITRRILEDLDHQHQQS